MNISIKTMQMVISLVSYILLPYSFLHEFHLNVKQIVIIIMSFIWSAAKQK